MQGQRNGRVLQFGAFELRTDTGEVRKHGTRVRLQGKPLQLLQALLDRPGDVVSRDELRERLWAADTFVDFESGLNTAVNRLRLALGDSADHPRYVETLARNGYRFISPVLENHAWPDESEIILAPPLPPPKAIEPQPRRSWLLAVFAAGSNPHPAAPWSASASPTSSSPPTTSRRSSNTNPSASKASTATSSTRFAASKNPSKTSSSFRPAMASSSSSSAPPLNPKPTPKPAPSSPR